MAQRFLSHAFLSLLCNNIPCSVNFLHLREGHFFVLSGCLANGCFLNVSSDESALIGELYCARELNSGERLFAGGD